MSYQMQLSLFGAPPSITELITKREDQWFERKSFRQGAQQLADSMIGFANADGGRIAVGIHQGRVEGVGSNPHHLNELLQAAIDFTEPPVRHSYLLLDVVNDAGQPDQILLLDIEASESVHRNRRGECYLRVGDENRRLRGQEERELAFDKGESVFDKTSAPEVDLEDLDLAAIQEYADKMGATSVDGLMRSRGLVRVRRGKTEITHAGWLIFGIDVPIWSYVRYIRVAGRAIETGMRSNLTEDIRIDGTIPQLIEQAKLLLAEKLDTVIRMGPNGRFDRMPTVPEFAWLEAVVNALTHRSYSMQGDGVRIIQFEDRLEVHSPGRLPHLVRVQNIRESRYSRNPHIARVLAELTGYVRELNEGVRRMFEEMARHGLPEPRYSVSDSSVKVTLFKYPEQRTDREAADASVQEIRKTIGSVRLAGIARLLQKQARASTKDIASELGVVDRTARSALQILERHGLVFRDARSDKDPQARWVALDSPLWDELAK